MQDPRPKIIFWLSLVTNVEIAKTITGFLIYSSQI